MPSDYYTPLRGDNQFFQVVNADILKRVEANDMYFTSDSFTQNLFENRFSCC